MSLPDPPPSPEKASVPDFTIHITRPAGSIARGGHVDSSLIPISAEAPLEQHLGGPSSEAGLDS